MLRKSLPATLLAVLLLAIGSMAGTGRILLAENWGERLELRRTPEGEVMGVGAVFADSTGIYCYSLAGRKLLVYGSGGSFLREIPLETIGRGTWAGDDFVVLGDAVYFLNSIDMRIEVFELSTGRHRGALQLPTPLFPGAHRRSRKLLDRIFVRKGRLLVGNAYRVVRVLSGGLGRRAALSSIHRAPEGHRFQLFSHSHPLLETTEGSLQIGSRDFGRPPASEMMIRGKRYFLLEGRVFVLRANSEGLLIEEHQ
jgi:hypothetical protein